MWFYLILGIVGAAVGSFLNVAIWRYVPERPFLYLPSLRGRSKCPYCQKELQWFELIPLFSFVLQGGKCRSCSHRLPLQYPLIEAASALIFAGMPLFLNRFYGISLTLVASLDAPRWYYSFLLLWIFVLLVWLLVVAIDIRYYLIPNGFTLSLFFAAVLIMVLQITHREAFEPFRESFLKQYSLIFSPFQGILLNKVLGFFAGGLWFWILSAVSRGKAMGFGDVKLAFATGLLIGWPDIALAIILAFVGGGIVGGYAVLSKKKNMHDVLPFAPLFFFGILLTMFFGATLISLYFRLFNA